ncbi:hypothetical protein RFI_25705, partial [Reticulomyxa filosa]
MSSKPTLKQRLSDLEDSKSIDTDIRSIITLDEEVIDLDTIAKSELLASNEEIRNTMRQYTAGGNREIKSSSSEANKMTEEDQGLPHKRGGAGYAINYNQTLRVHIDENQYVTIPVTTETTVRDAIDFIQKRKGFDINEHQVYFFIDAKLQPLETKLHLFLNNTVAHTFEIQMKPNYIKSCYCIYIYTYICIYIYMYTY